MAKKIYKTEDIADMLVKYNGYVFLAAKALGCSAKTIYRRLDEVNYLRETLDEIRGQEIDIAEQKLRQAILNGEPWAISLKLKTQGKDRGYSERTEFASDGKLEIVVTYAESKRNNPDTP
jgi:hypothetical protein